MNDPRSSNGRGGAAKQAITTVSDLGTEQGAWKDLEEVSRGQQGKYSFYKNQENLLLCCKGCTLCFFSGASLLRSRLRQADTGEETAFVPQACITARKTLKTCDATAVILKDGVQKAGRRDASPGSRSTDPGSSRGREGGAQRDLPAPSDLG